MPDASTLKQRIRNGDPVTLYSAPIHTSEAELQAIIRDESPDLIGVDLQHFPNNEDKLHEYCVMVGSYGLGIRLRLRHPREAYLAGNFLDLGPNCILVPQVETEATVDEVLDAFYYPPVGKRSWGPSLAFGYDESMANREYADWWNQTGILCLQLESINAVINARRLAKPGVDMLMFGANDLLFDIETYSDPPFTTVEECIEHVVQQMEGTGVRVAAGPKPAGTF